MEFECHRSGAIDYIIERSKRATGVKITVDAARGAVVTAPPNFTNGLIETLVREKSGWIRDRLEYLALLAGCPVPRRFEDGYLFLFLGKKYALRVEMNTGPALVWLAGGEIHVALPHREGKTAGAVREALGRWYKEQARRIIKDRVEYLAELASLQPAGVRVKTQKCRWGSCSARGNLNLSWKLVMAPLEIIDYVVVHELCHLVRMDHSADFWRRVALVCPDYKKRRRWLREYGPVLAF